MTRPDLLSLFISRPLYNMQITVNEIVETLNNAPWPLCPLPLPLLALFVSLHATIFHPVRSCHHKLSSSAQQMKVAR